MQVSNSVLQTTSKNSIPVTINQGYIYDIHPDTYSVDVTIPSTSMIMYGVALSMPTMSKESRSIAMPKIGSPITVCTTSTGGTPIALGAYYTPSAETTNSDGMNEIVYPGENLQTGGLSYLKQTRDGNMLIGSKIATGTSFMNSGKTYSHSLEKHETALNFDAHDGFSTEDISDLTSHLYTRSQKTYYKEITKPCNVYPASTAFANRVEILGDTQDILDLIYGTATSTGYIASIAALQDIFTAYNATSAAEKIAAAEVLMNAYILDAIGPHVHLDFGYVSDDTANIPVTAVQSSEGNNVIARMQIVPEAGTTGEILIDDHKNINMNNIGDFLLNGSQIATMTEIDEIHTALDTGVTQTPTIVMGMNSVITKTDGVEAIPKFTMTGRSFVNLLGSAGNCEDTSKFTVATGSAATAFAVDTATKIFGNCSIKLQTSASGTIYRGVPITLTSGKYYFLSGYGVSSDGLTNGYFRIRKSDGSYIASSAQIIGTSFVRTGSKIVADGTETSAGLYVYQAATGSGYVNMDGVMLIEITADEYNNLTIAQLLAKYFYADSYVCSQNPYIEVRHDNLVRNGNGEEGIAWWIGTTASNAMAIESGKLKVTSAGNDGFYQRIPVLSNTSYYLSGNTVNGTATAAIRIYGDNSGSLGSLIRTGSGTFSTGTNTTIWLYLLNSAAGTGYYDSLMVTQGLSAPTAYKSCQIERCVIEGKFTTNDSFVLENGEVTGLLNWKHKTLFGKDYDWQYTADYTGYKRVGIPLLIPTNGTIHSADCQKLIKYNGAIETYYATIPTTSDQFLLYNADGALYLSLADTDTGWGESIAPNADEVKVFMNGWKAIYNNGTRYLGWVSLYDSSAPAIAVKTAITTAATSATQAVTAGTGTNFATNDVLYIMRGSSYVGPITVSSTTANTIVATGSWTSQVGDILIKADTTSSTPLLTWCKNNIAPNYDGYQLHYKLANPEPITDITVRFHGDIPKLEDGDNYLYLDYGMVLDEIANPTSNGVYYFIGIRNPASTAYQSKLAYEQNAYPWPVYKNGIFDPYWTTSLDGLGTPIAQGLAAIDTNATWTVDYQILKTMHTAPTSLTMSYQQDVLNAITDLTEIAENKQTHDSALDALVDLSMYEEVTTKLSNYFKWIQTAASTLYVQVFIPMSTKKCVPIITLENITAKAYNGTSLLIITDKLETPSIVWDSNGVCMQWIVRDADTITAIKSYGAYLLYGATITADCRGRL